MPIHLASLAAHPGLIENLIYQLNGLLVVFVALGVLWGLLEFSGWIFRGTKAKNHLADPHTSTRPAQPAPDDQASATFPHLVVISAAIHVALCGRIHRLVSVTSLPDRQDWSREGRRQIFSSHKVR